MQVYHTLQVKAIIAFEAILGQISIERFEAVL